MLIYFETVLRYEHLKMVTDLDPLLQLHLGAGQELLVPMTDFNIVEFRWIS